MINIGKELALIECVVDNDPSILTSKRVFMRYLAKVFCGSFVLVLLSSCGAIPTLPPLDSTITFRTPEIAIIPSGINPTTDKVEPADLPTTQPDETNEPGFTATYTAVPSSPTQAVSATVLPSSTPTPMPTSTATFTPTYTHTPVPTFTPTAVPYALQLLNPFYLTNFTHPEYGCSWMGVAGQIFNKEGQVQKEIVIKTGGSINGVAAIEDMVMPLTEPEIDLAYGPGGFEITLATEVAATDGEAWIQLYSLSGDPLSERIYLVTYDDCLRNLILMNFSEK